MDFSCSNLFLFLLFFLITNSISLLVISLFISFISSWFKFWWAVCFWRKLVPFLLDCLICWHIKVHSIPLFFFNFSNIYCYFSSFISYIVLFGLLFLLFLVRLARSLSILFARKNQVLVLMIFLRFFFNLYFIWNKINLWYLFIVSFLHLASKVF